MTTEEERTERIVRWIEKWVPRIVGVVLIGGAYLIIFVAAILVFLATN